MNKNISGFDKQSTIQSRLTKQLFSVGSASLVTSILLAAILAYVQRNVISPAIVYPWLSLIVFSRSRVQLSLRLIYALM